MATIISKSITAGHQDVLYLEVCESLGYKFRIDIRSDSYQNQCHAHCDVYSKPTLSWNRISFIPAEAMQTEPKLLYLPNKLGLKDTHFKADRDNLMRQAGKLLDLDFL